jgi:hypothetical protein
MTVRDRDGNLCAFCLAYVLVESTDGKWIRWIGRKEEEDVEDEENDDEDDEEAAVVPVFDVTLAPACRADSIVVNNSDGRAKPCRIVDGYMKINNLQIK